MPRAYVVPKGAHDVVEHLDRDVARLQRGLERRGVAARAGEEHVALDSTREARCHGVAHRQVLVGVALEGGAPQLPVRVGQQGGDSALRDLVQLAVLAHGRGECEVGVGQDAVHRQSAGQRVGDLGQQLLDLGAADALLQLLQAVEVVAEVGQPRRLRHPFAQPGQPDLEHLRDRKRGRRAQLGRHRPGAVAASRRLLVADVDRVGHRRVDDHLGQEPVGALIGVEPVGQGLRRVAQVALELAEVGEAGEDGVDGLLPVRGLGKDALGVPGVALVDVGARR